MDEVAAKIARVCHEVNRAYCEAIGDPVQPPWEEAPEWQVKSALEGVIAALNDRDRKPADSHKGWMDHKLADGWKFGEAKNPERKEHPCMVSFEELPVEQRAKDHLFLAVVRALG